MSDQHYVRFSLINFIVNSVSLSQSVQLLQGYRSSWLKQDVPLIRFKI